MTSTSLFPAADDDTRQAILRAAYDALCEHGYADLSTQRIADASPKSKSLIYHHYDDKDDLLLDLLDHLLERFQTETRADADDPREHVQEVLDHVLAVELPPERRAFTRAMVSLRAQAAYDDDYREHFDRHDDVVHDRLRDAIAAGRDAGAFRDVDPDRVASLLSTTIAGATTRRVTGSEDAVPAVRAELQRYVEECLLAD
ncbi:MAG: TetR/AcrR family transcriptional regulator [Halobacterium sp.]